MGKFSSLLRRTCFGTVNKRNIFPLIFFPILFIYYLYISPNGIVCGDGGEIATMAMKGGLTHPPGYNIVLWFYNIGGNIARILGLNPDKGMALVSVLFILLSMVFIYLSLKNRGIYFLSFVIVYIATIPFLVLNTITVEVYSLSILLASILIYTISTKHYTLFFYIYGLSLAHHRSFIGLMPIAIYLFVKNNNKKWNMILFFIGITPILYNVILFIKKPIISYNATNLYSYLTGNDYKRYFIFPETLKAVWQMYIEFLRITLPMILFILLPVRFDKWRDWKEFLLVLSGIILLPFLILPSYSVLSIESAMIFYIPLIIFFIYFLPYRYLKWNISYVLLIFVLYNIFNTPSLKDGGRFVDYFTSQYKNKHLVLSSEEVFYPLMYYYYVEDGKGCIKDKYNRYVFPCKVGDSDSLYRMNLPSLSRGYTLIDSIAWIKLSNNVKQEDYIKSSILFGLVINDSINDTLMPYVYLLLEKKPPSFFLLNKMGYYYIKDKNYSKGAKLLYKSARIRPYKDYLWADCGVSYLFDGDTLKAIKIWREGLKYNPNSEILTRYIKGIKNAHN